MLTLMIDIIKCHSSQLQGSLDQINSASAIASVVLINQLKEDLNLFLPQILMISPKF